MPLFFIPSPALVITTPALPRCPLSPRHVTHASAAAPSPRPPRPDPTSSTTPILTPASPRTLYDDLNLPCDPSPSTLPLSALRAAYLAAAKAAHPDAGGSDTQFERVSRAWTILSDPASRRLYDSTGEQGLSAVASIDARADALAQSLPDVAPDELDHLADTGALVGTLLSAAAEHDLAPPQQRPDACPRSVEDALQALQNRHDPAVTYYTLWWVYRFRVVAAVSALVQLLQDSGVRAFALRRRAALALGAVVPAQCSHDRDDAIVALARALGDDDYFLRYRTAEALAGIGARVAQLPIEDRGELPREALTAVLHALQNGVEKERRRFAAKSGYDNQEGLFDLDALPEETRVKLEKVFAARRAGEQRARRTTMTPQLGVDAVGREGDEPLEWLLKAASALAAVREDDDPDFEQVVSLAEELAAHDVPLVRYAACKALFTLTNRAEFAERIVDALDFGVEHHYSQRVLIRDLGDLGYSQGAKAVAECPMVENSFKILALKNMLNKHECNADKDEVRNVLSHMDSLL